MNNMKKATFLRKMLWLLFVPFLAVSCEDKMSEHYEVPDWVPGSAWEVLSSGEHGNYSIFLVNFRGCFKCLFSETGQSFGVEA